MPHPRPSVWVVGDSMLDAATRSSHFRRSPEDPTAPVLAHTSPESAVPGGAANVAANLSALGAAATLLAPRAYDTPGDQLTKLLHAGGVAIGPSPTAPGTTVKHRYFEGARLIARVDADFDSPAVYPPVVDRGPTPDAVVLTDYGRGAISAQSATAWAVWCKDRKVPLYADPKDGRQRVWDTVPVDCMVANWTEATKARPPYAAEWPDIASERDALGLARRLVTGGWGPFGVVVVKRGEHGSVWASYCTKSILTAHLGKGELSVGITTPVAPRAVYDVTGAGDSFLAGLVIGCCRGLAMRDACLYGSAAAGVAVGKPGTAIVSANEVVAVLRGVIAKPVGVVSEGEAVAISERLRGFGFTVGMSAGCFDLLHPGHLAVISGAAKACDFLFAPVDSDARVRTLKGDGRPVVAEADRVALLGALSGVGAAFTFDSTVDEVVEKLQPDVLVKGGDYTPETMPEAIQLKGWGGRVVIVPTAPHQRTTDRVAQLRKL